jgi:methanethiol oxidase
VPLAASAVIPKDQLPLFLKGFGVVPPFVTDIDLSMDDRFLYVSCWGTAEMRQYDVTEPRKPKLTGSVRIGGIANHTPHPNGRRSGRAAFARE